MTESFKKFITESYPIKFNFFEFNQITTFKKKLDYAKNHLKRISSGSSRVVFMIDNEKVLKIAKNKKGLAQNNVECDQFLQNYNITARVFKEGESVQHLGPFWIEMEFAKRVSPKSFKKITGFSIEEIYSYIQYFDQLQNPFKYKNSRYRINISDELKDRCSENEFVQEIIDLIYSYDMEPGDFGKLNSYGEVIRNGKPAIVLIDFGFSRLVANDFYKVNF